MRKTDFYADVTNKIISKLEEGTLPWRKSWKEGLPRNYVTKRLYNGINFINLCFEDYPSPYYLTYLQCKEKGGYVLKGEEGRRVIFWKPIVVEETEEDEIKLKQALVFRISNVFNLAQTSLFETEKGNTLSSPSILKCEEIIKGIEGRITIKHNFRRCYYNTKEDYVSIPLPEDFDSKEEYYAALFHEIAHATGHPSRLKRDFSKENYATEELIAELTSSFLCSYCGIEQKTINNQANYLANWLESLKESPNFIARVASEARKAAEFILYG